MAIVHSKPVLKIILPYKTKSYNDVEEQETEGIPIHNIHTTKKYSDETLKENLKGVKQK